MQLSYFLTYYLNELIQRVFISLFQLFTKIHFFDRIVLLYYENLGFKTKVLPKA